MSRHSLEEALVRSSPDFRKIGALLGLASAESGRDLLTCESEIDCLTVAEFLRLCMLLDVRPSDILDDEPEADPHVGIQGKPGQRVDCAATLKERLGDIDSAAEELGWEAEAVRGWLSSDWTLANMPFPAFQDLCVHARLGPSALLYSYLRGAGWRR
jgi:hypothetical protein